MTARPCGVTAEVENSYYEPAVNSIISPEYQENQKD